MRRLLLCAATACMLTTWAGAQDAGSWHADSKTARSVTGDIVLSGERLYINFSPFTVAQLRTLQPEEVTAVFNADAAGVGTLYRLNIPADRKFMHKNTMCGPEDVTYMVTAVDNKNLQVAFFSGAKMPTLTGEEMVKTTNLCGIYSYRR